ncbi:MAG: glycosyltransferase family 2 protein [Clostridia bacterium]|jgi:glycosyltransferase involved in cell wall biosynthesis|nr:glycosyltransferase family 2 protein [Clostridia bacterium]
MSVSVVIPAYNEEKYISNVLAPLQGIEEICEIIVVSDGSADHTAVEALKWSAAVIELPENIGKGGAMLAGLQQAQGEIILFLDADLIGLKPEHIRDLIAPVLNKEADMTLGLFDSGRIRTDLAQLLAPSLSGQRCIRKELLDGFDEWVNCGFGVETALTNYALNKNLRIQQVRLAEMTHVMKEEKYGLVRGLAYRMKMYWQIVRNLRRGA